MNEVIADKKDINNEMFCNYFKYQNPSFLAKDLIRAKELEIISMMNLLIYYYTILIKMKFSNKKINS